MPEAKLDVEGGATGEEIEDGLLEAVEVVGMHAGQEKRQAADVQFLGFVSEQVLDFGADVEDAAVLIRGPGDVGLIGEDAAKFLSTFFEERCGLPDSADGGTHPRSDDRAEQEGQDAEAGLRADAEGVERREEEIVEDKGREEGGEKAGTAMAEPCAGDDGGEKQVVLRVRDEGVEERGENSGAADENRRQGIADEAAAEYFSHL